MTTDANEHSEPGQPLGLPLNDQLGPVAEVVCGRLRWHIPHERYSVPLKFINNDTHPLYDQAALDAAVAAERERWQKLCEENSAACMAEIARLQQVRCDAADEIERLRAALAELVAVKDLKERTEAMYFAGPLSDAGDGWQAEYEAGRKEYLRRQPAAWEAARAALRPNAR